MVKCFFHQKNDEEIALKFAYKLTFDNLNPRWLINKRKMTIEQPHVAIPKLELLTTKLQQSFY